MHDLEDVMADDDKIDLSMFLPDYLNDSKEGFQKANSALLDLEKGTGGPDQLNVIFRVVHTLKSSSTMLKFSDIADFAHASEELLDRMRKNEVLVSEESLTLLFEIIDTLEEMVRYRATGAQPTIKYQETLQKIETLGKTVQEKPQKPIIAIKGTGETILPVIEKAKTVRVNVDVLDSLFNLVGELIITKNRIDTLLSGHADKELKSALTTMAQIINEVQEDVSAARLVPAEEVFQKFPRMVHDLARNAQKEIDFIVKGSEIELDKSLLDAIGEPLIHLLRNAVDHGIESQKIREKEKKAKKGTITLEAQRTEDFITISVEDDGGGIDYEYLKQVFLKKGLIPPEKAGTMTADDIMGCLFKPGFTSAQSVTGVSGRGVGLNIVETSVKQLGGTIEIASKIKKGTRFTLKFPLSTTIMQTLLVGLGDRIFAIPAGIVVETFRISTDEIKELPEGRVLIRGEHIYPYESLGALLNLPEPEDRQEIIIVIIAKGENYIALGVDELVDQTETIIKPFDPIAQKFKGFSGGTILGDGRVVLLLDISSIAGFEYYQKSGESYER
ncbi:MAG: chemotaxis protein CheA [Methanoregula sp.]|nr:chemotaxis protein CheA [Methanoregula sp.]